MKDFRELQVWQKAHQLTWAVYPITATFPREELYGLTDPLRPSSSSVSANLAEGCGRNGDPAFARFCSIAMGSASELEYHLLLARDLKLIPAQDYQELARRVRFLSFTTLPSARYHTKFPWRRPSGNTGRTSSR